MLAQDSAKYYVINYTSTLGKLSEIGEISDSLSSHAARPYWYD